MIEPEKPLKKTNKIRLDEDLLFQAKAKKKKHARRARERIQKLFVKDHDKVNMLVDMLRVGERELKVKAEAGEDDGHHESIMKVIPDKEEAAVDAIPLATKPPSIVDWKIIKEGKIGYYQMG
ncbi:hypothetical protein Tco_0359543 [Tanacetum coccineum]